MLRYNSNWAPLQFVAAGPVRQLPSFGYLAWNLVDGDKNVGMSGFDVALVKDGVVAELYTVLQEQ